MGTQSMKVLISALIQQKLGQTPTKQSVAALLNALGENDSDKEIDTFFEKLGTQDMKAVIEEGKKQMAVEVVASAPAAAGSASDAPAKAEEKKEEEEVEFDAFDDLF